MYEHPAKKNSWPTEGVVQVWDEKQKRWQTAAFGVFLTGPVNTYLKGLTKMRYVPWGNYFRNFYTCEIAVR